MLRIESFTASECSGDSWVFGKNAVVLCDGFGRGELARQSASRAALTAIHTVSRGEPQTSWDDVHAQAQSDVTGTGASTVAYVLHLAKTGLVHSWSIGWLGDTRIGILSKDNKEIHWLTLDHTKAAELRRAGISVCKGSTLEDALTKYLGHPERMEPCQMNLETNFGDSLVLATDGFWAEWDADDLALLAEQILDRKDGWRENCLVRNYADDATLLVVSADSVLAENSQYVSRSLSNA